MSEPAEPEACDGIDAMLDVVLAAEARAAYAKHARRDPILTPDSWIASFTRQAKAQRSDIGALRSALQSLVEAGYAPRTATLEEAAAIAEAFAGKSDPLIESDAGMALSAEHPLALEIAGAIRALAGLPEADELDSIPPSPGAR